MRVLNLNFLSCAVKACKATNKSFPLHPKDAELVQDDDVEYKPEILVSLLPRLNWEALRTTCTEVRRTPLPDSTLSLPLMSTTLTSMPLIP